MFYPRKDFGDMSIEQVNAVLDNILPINEVIDNIDKEIKGRSM